MHALLHPCNTYSAHKDLNVMKVCLKDFISRNQVIRCLPHTPTHVEIKNTALSKYDRFVKLFCSWSNRIDDSLQKTTFGKV